jgi:histidinol-phosphate aminotransferase
MSLFRPAVDALEGYVPGEQPRESGWVKLNTNENPYAPSPRVVEAIEQAARGRLNIYPDPLVTSFRRAAAELFDLDPEWFLPANGSDENLTILMRTFVDPGERIALPYPSYVLYETLAEIQGASFARLPLGEDWSFDFEAFGDKLSGSKLAFVPNPNSPSGNRWPDEDLERLVPPEGVLVLDEAYGDFADEPHRGELLQSEFGSRLVVTRTLSKSYSLAGLRFGFCVAHPDLIAGMRKVKDSYNCDTLAIAAATAALLDQDWMRANRAKILATRARLSEELRGLGFSVQPSQSNFVWVTHDGPSHESIFRFLKEQQVLVRFMTFPHAGPKENQPREGLRISVGTDAEIDRLLDVLKVIL